MKYTREDILALLKNYGQMKRTVLQLQYELDNRHTAITANELISSMSFNNPVNGQTSAGAATDKIENIALSYTDMTESINRKYRDELTSELTKALADIERLEYYIALLDDKQSAILRMQYLEGMHWQ